MLICRHEGYLYPLLKSPLRRGITVLFLFFFLYGCSAKYAGPRIIDGGVRFSIKAQNAKKVTITGSFNKWDAERDALVGPDEEGVWSITLPLGGGRYEYLFVIDGDKWVLDPGVPFADDGMGGKNSVFVLRK